MPSFTFQVKRILKSIGLPSIIVVGVGWVVIQIVGTPSQTYRTFELSSSNKTEKNYFDKELHRMIKEVNVEGKSGVRYWEDLAKERAEAEKLKRKRIQELIKEGRVSQEDVVKELRKIDNVIVKDSVSDFAEPTESGENNTT